MSRVMKIEIDNDEEMADLEVEDVHCFYANGVLVHNCAEEMRIAAGLSGEPVWVNAINNDVDLHKATASEAFHVTVENVEPKQRKTAKSVNFACLYDGNEYTIASRCKMPIEEAKAFYDDYTKALKVLYSWKAQRYQEGRTTGSVRNIFGHERRVYSYYHSNSRNLQAFADRTVISNSIQGTAAVFMRIILTKLERMIYEPDGKWYGKGVIHIANIHDEVDFLVPKKYAKEFCWDLKTVMESVTPPNWPIKMEASPEIGNNFGEIFEVSIVKNEDGSLHFVPKCETPPEKEPVAVTVTNEATSDLNLPDEETEEMGDFVF